jgi:hypothetical protein
MREQALLPWDAFARMILGLFDATLAKVWPVCDIVLLSGIEAQKFSFFIYIMGAIPQKSTPPGGCCRKAPL